MSLVFYEKSHRYRLDGKWVPGVTTLIDKGYPNDALKFWSARYVAEWVAAYPDLIEAINEMGGYGPAVAFMKELPWQKRDVAGERGTEVHKIAEQIVGGEMVAVPQDLTGYVRSALAFMDDWGIEPLITEGRVAHRRDGWAGTGDLWAACKSAETVYFDWKTGGVYPKHAFQACAYTHAEFWMDRDVERPLPPVDYCRAVKLTEDDYQVLPLETGDDVYAEFLQIMAIAATRKRAEPSRTSPGYVGYPLPTPGGDDD